MTASHTLFFKRKSSSKPTYYYFQRSSLIHNYISMWTCLNYTKLLIHNFPRLYLCLCCPLCLDCFILNLRNTFWSFKTQAEHHYPSVETCLIFSRFSYLLDSAVNEVCLHTYPHCPLKPKGRECSFSSSLSHQQLLVLNEQVYSPFP